jgi:hypothetical protein
MSASTQHQPDDESVDWTPYIEPIDGAFAGAERPEHFTNYTHCCECSDSDEFFQNLTPQQLLDLPDPPETLPFAFLTEPAFYYYMPAFARMLTRSGERYCVGDILFFIENRIWTFDEPQRAAFRDLLYAVYERLAPEIEATPFDYPMVWRILNELDGPPSS